MSTTVSPRRLLGRRSECAALDELVASVRTGQSRALVVRGDAGVGKTALLEYLARTPRMRRRPGGRSRVRDGARVRGVAAAVRTASGSPRAPPGPQRDALGTAFGLRDGDAPDRFLVGLAVLSLLSDVAEDQSLVCIVDDAQWLDAASAQALAFVARRLGAESVGLVFAVREPNGERQFEGCRSSPLAGWMTVMHTSYSRPWSPVRLTSACVIGSWPRRAATRWRCSSCHVAGRLPSSREGSGCPTGRRCRGGSSRASGAAGATAALDAALASRRRCRAAGDPVLVWRAAAELGIGPDAAAPATAAGLVDFGAQVRFGHTLVRSAVKRAATPEERQRVHRRWPKPPMPTSTPIAAPGTSRTRQPGSTRTSPPSWSARPAERGARRPGGRGGISRARRRADARSEAPGTACAPRRKGQAQAGANDAALRLLAVAKAGPLDELEQARAQLLHAQITFAMTRGRDAPPAARCGQAARAAGSEARARDIPRGVRGCAVRRPPGARRRCARGRRGRSGR